MQQYTNTSLTQKTSAILCADIHSFSQKVVQDEATALALLKTYDDLMNVLSRRFNGFIVRSLGDLVVIDFPLSLNALNCAIEIQRRLWSYNKNKEPLDKIEIRVGIHKGEVRMHENEAVGDAVEDALFIESLAEPNRILISHDVYLDIQQEPSFKVYNLGKFKLRTIGQPTELYEVLIDSIPEFARPSASAEFFRKHYSVDQITRQRFETEEEARKIEETRQRTSEEQRRNEEKRKKIIEELYQRAEVSLQKGNLEDAERALKEVQQYSTSLTKETVPLLTAQEQEIRTLLQRSEQYLAQGQFTDAEAEVNKVFMISPLHIGAHQMLLRIEEEQAKRNQQESTEQSNTFLDPHVQKINELVEKVRHHIAREEFTDARFTLREIFKLDPNHYAGRQMENELAAAIEAHSERHRHEQALREARERQMHIEELKRKIEEQRRRRSKQQRTSKKEKQFSSKLFIGISAGILIVIGLILLYSYFFLSEVSIVLLPPTGSSPIEKQHPFNKSLTHLITYDIASWTPLTIINPSTAMLFDYSANKLPMLGRFLNVRYAITGTVNVKGSTYTITYNVSEIEDPTPIVSFSSVVTTENISSIRLQLLTKLCELFSLKCSLPSSIDWTTSPEAAGKYLVALSKLPSFDTTTLLSSARLCESAFTSDQSFWLPARDAAYLYYQLYDLTSNTDVKERAAICAQRAISLAPHDPLTRILEARSLRYANKLQDARSLLENIANHIHSIGRLYEEQATVYLRQNKIDNALEAAKNAVAVDPKNPQTLVILGLVYHIAQRYDEALGYYDSAIKLGYPEYYLMNYARSYALLEAGKFNNFLKYYTSYIKQNPTSYQAYYRIGQAYQWKTQVQESQQWLNDGLLHVQNAIIANPSNATAHAYAALFFARLGKFDASKIEIEKALELAPTNPDILLKASATFSILKEDKKSLQYLRNALELHYRFDIFFDPDFSTLSTMPEFTSVITF